MDPLTAAGTFATLVGLLANFKAERSGSDLADFMEWLKQTHHEDVARAIAHNQNLEVALTNLLGANHDDVVLRLKQITEQLELIAGGIEGFAPIVRSIQPSGGLSPQAKSILKQIVDSGADFVMERKLLSGTDFVLIGNGSGEIEVPEPQFIEEDFESLLSLGLLRVEYMSKGSRKFTITRAGVAAAQ